MDKAKKSPIEYVFSYITAVVEYMLVILVIMECNSMYRYSSYVTNKIEAMYMPIALGLLIYLLLFYLFKQRHDLKGFGSQLLLLVILCILNIRFLDLGVKHLGNHNLNKDFFEKFIILTPLLVLVFWLQKQQGKQYNLWFRYADVVFFYAMISLVVFSVFIVNPDIMPSVHLQGRWAGTIYDDIVSFFNFASIRTGETTKLFGHTVYRNVGFFTEPPMYNVTLITALYTEMFLRNSRKRWPKCILLTLAIFTTQASLAFMLTIVAYGLKILEKIKGKYKVPIIATTVALVLVGLIVVVANKAQEAGTSGYSSFAVHIEDYKIALDCFADHPVVGVGYSAIAKVQAYMTPERFAANCGFSNSSALILAEGGIFLGLICMIPYILGMLQLCKKKTRAIGLWSIGVFGVYMVMIIHYHFYLLMVIAFGYSLIDVDFGERKLSIWSEVRQRVGREKKHVIGEKRNKKIVWVLCKAILCMLGLAILYTNKTLWDKLFSFFWTHRMFMSQSFWKLPFVGVAIAEIVLLYKMARGKRNKIKNEIASVITVVIYFLFEANVYAHFHTLYNLNGVENDWGECLWLWIFFSSVLVLVWGCLNILWKKDKKVKLLSSVLVEGIGTAIVIACFLINGKINQLARDYPYRMELKEVIRILEDEPDQVECGRVFANDIPVLWRKESKTVCYSNSADEAFSVTKNVSVITEATDDIEGLLQKGFKVARLSEHFILYSNDVNRIAVMEEKGYHFSKNYAFEKYIDLEGLAERNSLSFNNDGEMLVKGQFGSLIYGPYSDLQAGSYEAVFHLKFYEGTYNGQEILCTLRVSEHCGGNILIEQPITPDMLDSNGCYQGIVPFAVSDTFGMEYLIFANGDTRIGVMSIGVREVPQYE